jgi:hypothetical protein
MNSVLFLIRGRTLGMAAFGLGVDRGRKWLALALTPLLLTVIFVVAFLTLSAIQQARDMGEDVQTVAPLAGLVTLALNLAFLIGSRRRPLTDLISGLHVLRDPALPALRGGLHAGLNFIDWLVAACIVVPILPMLGHPSSPGAAIASFAGLVAFGALELVLWRKTGATLGARAWATHDSAAGTSLQPSPSPPARPR